MATKGPQRDMEKSTGNNAVNHRILLKKVKW